MANFRVSCCVLCFLLLPVTRDCQPAEVIVRIPAGLLRGTRIPVTRTTHAHRFLGIPYARPPVGDLRFRKPLAPENWEGVRDATRSGPKCPQPEISRPPRKFSESEDCLYLNVFTPEISSNRHGPQELPGLEELSPFPQRSPNTRLLPVMMWIHGGGYYEDTGGHYDGTQLAARGVVVVTINYRLGALGFLSAEDLASPGNYGLWDMIRALEWVRESIAAFTGDPNDVTIFGQSAGSASISLLLLTDAAKGLFNKAIMESGVSLCPWAVGYPRLVPQPKEQAVKLARRLGCQTRDAHAMVDCLRTKDADTLLNVSMEITFEIRGTEAVYLPVPEATFSLDGELFAATPEELIASGHFANITTIRGYNSEEGGKDMKYIDPTGVGISREKFDNLTKAFVQDFFAQTSFAVDTDRILSLLTEAYVIKPNITDRHQLRDVYIQILTDYWYHVPVLHELQLVNKYRVKPQYLYRFSYRAPTRLNADWQGVVHSDELYYVFGYPLSGDVMATGVVSEWTDEDRLVSDEIMTMWSNFAKYGDPTPHDVDGVRWLPWSHESPTSLDIGSSLHVRRDTGPEQKQLWLDIVQSINANIS